jgi:hypothetical protein
MFDGALRQVKRPCSRRIVLMAKGRENLSSNSSIVYAGQ